MRHPLTAWMLAMLLLGGCAATPATSTHEPAAHMPSPIADSSQLLVVSVADWNATSGELVLWQREGSGWHAADGPVPVTVGRSGSAWGIGLHPPQPGLQKREGDGRSPAGVFGLGVAFGYAGEAGFAWPYSAMDEGDWCIDVPESPLYNRIVDAGDVGGPAVSGSTEPMRRDLHADGDQRYSRGLVIEHNPAAVPGAGSCIFAHVWGSPGQATAGCTAMPAAALERVLAALDPAASPLFVLLPVSEYRRLAAEWRLPPSPTP